MADYRYCSNCGVEYRADRGHKCDLKMLEKIAIDAGLDKDALKPKPKPKNLATGE